MGETEGDAQYIIEVRGSRAYQRLTFYSFILALVNI
jgi:hypothetical protein